MLLPIALLQTNQSAKSFTTVLATITDVITLRTEVVCGRRAIAIAVQARKDKARISSPFSNIRFAGRVEFLSRLVWSWWVRKYFRLCGPYDA